MALQTETETLDPDLVDTMVYLKPVVTETIESRHLGIDLDLLNLDLVLDLSNF